MKLFKSTLSLILAASLIFATGCSNSAKKAITMGTLDGTKYTNEYFNFELNVPESWHIATEEEKAAITKAGQDAIAENNEKLAEQLDLSKEKTLNLMFAFKYPFTHQGFNPNVLCMAENLGLLGSVTVKSGKDYLAMTKTGMEQTGMPYTFGEVTTEKLGDKDFDTMEATIDAGEIKLTQKYYAAIFDGYALVFINTFSSEEEASETKGLLDTVSFK
jgi:hypothetical protein